MEKNPDKIGKYKLIREVGRGATATVYLAEHPQYPEPVALKLIRFDDKAKDEAKWNRRLLKLLRAEGSVARRLDHPHIIKIYEAIIEAEEAYVVMEYFPGESLERYCSFERLLPVHRAAVLEDQREGGDLGHRHDGDRGQGDGAQVELPAHDPAVVLAAGLEQAAQTSHVAHFAVSPVGEGDEARCAPHRL